MKEKLWLYNIVGHPGLYFFIFLKKGRKSGDSIEWKSLNLLQVPTFVLFYFYFSSLFEMK